LDDIDNDELDMKADEDDDKKVKHQGGESQGGIVTLDDLLEYEDILNFKIKVMVFSVFSKSLNSVSSLKRLS